MDKKWLIIGAIGVGGAALILLHGGGSSGAPAQATGTGGAVSSAGFGSFLDIPALGGIETPLVGQFAGLAAYSIPSPMKSGSTSNQTVITPQYQLL